MNMIRCILASTLKERRKSRAQKITGVF